MRKYNEKVEKYHEEQSKEATKKAELEQLAKLKAKHEKWQTKKYWNYSSDGHKTEVVLCVVILLKAKKYATSSSNVRQLR